MSNATITITVNGQTTAVTIPSTALPVVERVVNAAANPQRFTQDERIAHVIKLCGREEGATVSEIALEFDSGEQNKYNPVVKKLMDEKVIIRKGGRRSTVSGGMAQVHHLA